MKDWIDSRIPRFNQFFEEKLERLVKIINQILDIHFQHLGIKLSHFDFRENIRIPVNYKWQRFFHPQLFPIIKYNEKIESNFRHKLNEARLSALSLSIYLAGVIIQPKTKLKIMFLDDIFIGLDTSNRLPLLECLTKFKLKEDEKPFFEDFQIFITTYDRAWFESAKFYLNNAHWLTAEFYAIRENSLDFDIPFIVEPTETNYYEKAKKYCKKKNDDLIDFPAAGNYLRKECERVLKEDILFGKYKLEFDDGNIKYTDSLEKLWMNFLIMCKEFKINTDVKPYSDFNFIRKMVFNPLSHDNITEKPIYRKELDMAFSLVDKLRVLNKLILINKDDEIILTTTKEVDENIRTRKTFLKAKTDVTLLTFLKAKTRNKKSKVKYQCINYEEGGNIVSLNSQGELPIGIAYERVYYDFYGIENASLYKENDIYKEFSIDGITIKDKIDSLWSKT